MRIWDFAARAGRFAFWCVHTVAAPAGQSPRRAMGPGLATGSLARARLAPYRRDELHLSRNVGLGDVLMCTPAMREMKRLNPGCRITFYTDFPDLVEGLPFIDRVRPMAEQPEAYIWLNYEFSLPPRRHLARIFGDQLGVDVRDVRPLAVRPDLVERFRRSGAACPDPTWSSPGAPALHPQQGLAR